MKNMREIPWARLLSEGAIIVASILLAFSIDAWWDDRQDREDEQAMLELLHAELGFIRSSLLDIQDYQAAILVSAYRLAELSENPAIEVSDEEIARLVQDQTWLASPSNFSAPVLSAMLSRRDVSLIGDAALRMQLLQLPDKFTWIREVLQEDFDFSKQQLEPFMIRNGSFLHLSAVPGKRPGTSEFVFPESPVAPVTTFSHRSMIESREFQNLMMQRAVILEDTISLARTPDLLQQVDDVIAMIAQRLED